MAIREIYVKLSVTYADDPKVRALARYGADAGLARDLYVQMVLHCKRLLTDGFVPAEQVGLLVYPLDPEHGNQLAKQLASVGLIKEVSNAEASDKQEQAQGWQVCAYLKRNGTKDDVERLSEVRAEAGRTGGTKSRRPPGQRTAKPGSKQVAKQKVSQPDPYTETDTETKTGKDLPPEAATGEPPEAPGQRANRLARIYTDQVPISNFPAVAKIVRKAVDAECSDEHITRGLLKVISDNRSLTTESLRVAMFGPPRDSHPRGGAADPLTDQAYGPGSTRI